MNPIKAAFNALFRSQEEPRAEMFQFKSRERRKWFRVRPAEETPVILRFENHQYRVCDIGAAGLSFRSDQLAAGETCSAALELPQLGPPIQVPLKILSIDTRYVCHCSFEALGEDAVERIHQYVLRRQKEILRGKKEKKLKAQS